jgi:ComF family protein
VNKPLARAIWSLVGALGWLVRAVVGRALAIVAPPRCAGCDALLSGRAVFCGACAPSVERRFHHRAQAPRSPPDRRGALRVVAFGAYGGALAQALHRFKYRDRPDLALPLGELLRHASGALPQRIEVVVPVPLHFSRLAARGYNQSALLARIVARQLGARFAPRALGRTRASPPQVALNGPERRRRLAGAFVAREPTRLRGRAVLLVDDVTTTGATLAECAVAAWAAGAASVDALVLAEAEASPPNGTGAPT